uniref:tRNA-uridine aminocarboxypropyltransferase 1 n=1 Tax=Astyanax mexicanus TaxID=7994 RepID=A0A8B9HUY2_ASTMX
MCVCKGTTKNIIYNVTKTQTLVHTLIQTVGCENSPHRSNFLQTRFGYFDGSHSPHIDTCINIAFFTNNKKPLTLFLTLIFSLSFSLSLILSLPPSLSPALPQVELKSRKTCFWRHQRGSPDTYLATIEAIYYFLKDFHIHCLEREYNGEYDNLLFFYSFLHKLISKAKKEAGKS